MGNYYTDACLFAAGGKSAGKLDFYQMHTYTSGGVWNLESPFKVMFLNC
jgi:mannan endo-1,4-beta-mannosidase